MHEITMRWQIWLRGTRYDRPDIDQAIVEFLKGELVTAERIASNTSDPYFAYGRHTAYDCRNARGERKKLVCWGNTDGWGITEE